MNRETVGPFLVIGVDKDADAADIESQFAQRFTEVRRGEGRWSEADLIWARSILLDPELRIIADAENLNPDTASGEVRRLARVYHVDGSPPGWEPYDPEPPAELVNLESINTVRSL